MAVSTDREALEIAPLFVGIIPPEGLKIIMIKNTAWLVELEVSEAYADQIAGRGDLSVVKPAREIEFPGDGYLPPFDAL